MNADDETAPRRRAWYAVGLLTAVNVLNYVDRMLLPVLAQPIKDELGLSDTQLGLLTGFAFVALFAAVSFPLARLADHVGRNWILAACLAAWSAMTALSGFAQSFWQLALVRMGVGVGEAGGMPSSHATIADLFAPARRAVPLAIFNAGAALGGTIGMALGGFIAGAYGWRAAFIIVGLPGLLFAAVVALTLPDTRRAGVNRAAAPAAGTVATLLRIRTYRRLVCAHPFYTFITAGFAAWLAPFFVRLHHLPIAQAGLFLGISFAVGGVFGGIFGTWLLQRLSRGDLQRSLRLGGLLLLAAVAPFVAALLVADSWVALTLIGLFSTLVGGVAAPIVAGQQAVIEPAVRAQASALSLFFAAYAGGGLGPFLIGLGSDLLQPVFATDSLRAVLVLSSLGIVGAAWCLLAAAGSVAEDHSRGAGANPA